MIMKKIAEGRGEYCLQCMYMLFIMFIDINVVYFLVAPLVDAVYLEGKNFGGTVS